VLKSITSFFITGRRTPQLEVLISSDDAHVLGTHRCHPIKDGTAYKVHCCPNGRRRGESSCRNLARIIMDPPDGFVVDHINHERLDNRRENLRVVTSQQNSWNTRRHRDNQTGFKGVHRIHGYGVPRDRWRASILCPTTKKRIHLGAFDSPEEAARAYDRAAADLRGEFAVLNFPDEAS
jgi:hypothetical protein